jgi:hypothetical protein
MKDYVDMLRQAAKDTGLEDALACVWVRRRFVADFDLPDLQSDEGWLRYRSMLQFTGQQNRGDENDSGPVIAGEWVLDESRSICIPSPNAAVSTLPGAAVEISERPIESPNDPRDGEMPALREIVRLVNGPKGSRPAWAVFHVYWTLDTDDQMQGALGRSFDRFAGYEED